LGGHLSQLAQKVKNAGAATAALTSVDSIEYISVG
jgi:hypothetical protein